MELGARTRTLRIGRVVNLTNREIWVYGTSGQLLLLEPEELPRNRYGEFPPPADGTYYIVDHSNEVRHDKRYYGRLLQSRYIGDGRENRPIYHLILIGQGEYTKTICITDGMETPGEVLNSDFFRKIRKASLRSGIYR